MINLETLPTPEVFYEIDYEKELSNLEAQFRVLSPDYATLVLESDPIKKLLELSAYQTVLLKNEINEKLKQTMLAYATQNNLDNIAANTVTERLIIQAGDPNANPPIPTIWEADEDLRYRAQNAPKKWSVAGPARAYELLARSVDGRVKEVGVHAHTPKAGDVTLTIVTHDQKGVADEALLKKIENYLESEEVVPLCDSVYVKKAEFIDQSIEITVTYYKGQVKSLVDHSVQQRFEALKKDVSKLGEALTLNAIHDMARAPGVQNIKIIAPKADVVAKANQVIRLTGIKMNDGGFYAST
ncbi:baseplate assembly protein [Wohlfahrtiimonas chitiniclastica]|uniref:baseplate assembly protein n=1 Tax=Wohlfahrtiimonas chitiniclastica TaxID=400946 RepID=UPI001BCC4E67|nr:baseplate J/gp47 family protein [Wohlfahrtiimonas chitiniclastica]MBS7819046.1 baseplate J/gp47 family protein [Wohlfahrtiimonas chitiniclastica]